MANTMITRLLNDKYDIFNVNEKKAPINRQGKTMLGWNSRNGNELRKEVNLKNSRYGMRMGLQTNNKTILSLDFDTCGKPVDGVRIGCPDTQQELDNYRANTDKLDGMFSSSTQGNYNVLIDYTNSPTIKALVKNINSNKFCKKELEILLGGNQVIPPTATTSKITNTLGNARAFMNDQPFYVIENESGFVFAYVVSLMKEHLTKSLKPVVPANNNLISQYITSVSAKPNAFQNCILSKIYPRC